MMEEIHIIERRKKLAEGLEQALQIPFKILEDKHGMSLVNASVRS
jgi:hypothetical protein